MLDESRFLRDFAATVRSNPSAPAKLTHQFVMMGVVEAARDDLSLREFELYKTAVVAIMPPSLRKRIAKRLAADLGCNKIVSEDTSIREMIDLLTGSSV